MKTHRTAPCLPCLLLPAVLLFGAGPAACAQESAAGGGPAGSRLLPRLAARYDLTRTEADGDRVVTDLFAGPDGLLIGFDREFLTLGAGFEEDWRTARDLENGEPLGRELRESGFLATHAGFSPLGEVIQYDAGTGELLYTHPLTGERRRYGTGIANPLQCVILPAGGIALLREGEIVLFRRDAGGLQGRPIALPAGTYTCLAASSAGPALWAYDWRQRRVVVLTPDGDIVDSIALRAEDGLPLFPQVLEPCYDGGFLLGGSGELWRYSHRGTLLWRTRTYTRPGPSGELREALPPAFDLACPPGRPGFYLLDRVSPRLLLFQEGPPLPGEEEPGEGETAARAPSWKAEALRELSERLEQELLLEEAERACARSLELFRELQKADPVSPDWPAAIRRLTDRRARLRRILFEEAPLQADLPPVLVLYREETLELSNTGGRPLLDLQIDARFSGIPALAGMQFSRPDLPPGAAWRLPLTPRPEWGRESFFQGLRETAAGRLSLRIRCRIDGRSYSSHLGLPVTVAVEQP